VDIARCAIAIVPGDPDEDINADGSNPTSFSWRQFGVKAPFTAYGGNTCPSGM
jgi:hypothetical protein